MPPQKRGQGKTDEPNEGVESTENPTQVQKTGLRATTPTDEGDPVMTPDQSPKKPKPLTPVACTTKPKYLCILTAHWHNLWTLDFVMRMGDIDSPVFTQGKDYIHGLTYALCNAKPKPWQKCRKRQGVTGNFTNQAWWIFYIFNQDCTLNNASKLCLTLEKILQSKKASAENLGETLKEERDAKKVWLSDWKVILRNEIKGDEIELSPWDVCLPNAQITWLTRGPNNMFSDKSLEEMIEASGFFSPESPYNLHTCQDSANASVGSGGSRSSSTATGPVDFSMDFS